MNKDFVRFQWLRLPRIARATMIGSAVGLITVLGIVIVLGIPTAIFAFILSTFGVDAVFVIVILLAAIGIGVRSVWDDIQPSIKRKKHDE